MNDRTSVALSARLRRQDEAPPWGPELMRTWIRTVSLGEWIAFLAPAVAGVAMTALPPVWGGLLLLAAGALEGAVLGWAQARVIHRPLPALRSRHWIALTAVAAVAAYALGFLITALSGAEGLAPVAAMGPAGMLLLSSIGVAQWFELRHHVRNAARWVLWTAAAWLCGLATFLVIATPLWHSGQSVVAAIGVGLLAGLAMATTQAVVTGWGLTRLLRNRVRS